MHMSSSMPSTRQIPSGMACPTYSNLEHQMLLHMIEMAMLRLPLQRRRLRHILCLLTLKCLMGESRSTPSLIHVCHRLLRGGHCFGVRIVHSHQTVAGAAVLLLSRHHARLLLLPKLTDDVCTKQAMGRPRLVQRVVELGVISLPLPRAPRCAHQVGRDLPVGFGSSNRRGAPRLVRQAEGDSASPKRGFSHGEGCAIFA